MNWKNIVEKINAETYVIPAGWYSRDTVAEHLECAPEKVDDHLRPGLKSGRFQKQQVKVWDDGLKRVVYVVAYRDASRELAAKVAAQTEGAQKAPAGDTLATIRKLKASGLTWKQIGAKLGRTGEQVRTVYRRAA